MPARIEDFEIEERPVSPIENWHVEEQKERPYREDPESLLIWKYSSSLNRQSAIEKALIKLTADSKEILNCQDDSDDGFVPYSQETLDRAVRFLTAYINLAAHMIGAGVPIPKLLPGPSGSIDVHWKNEKKELIVNI